jgi:hypothetical protein
MTSDPTGTKNVLEHEVEMTTLADRLESTAIEMIETGDRISRATANQLLSTAYRYRRAAAALSADRAARAYVEHLERQRPPMKR